MRCHDCAYDLRGLAEHRCPECGRAFNPATPKTFLRKPVRARWRFMLALASIPLMMAPPILIQTVWMRNVPPWTYPLWPISIMSGFVMAWEAARRSIKLLRSGEPWFEDRWAALPAAIIGITLAMLCILATFGILLYRRLAN